MTFTNFSSFVEWCMGVQQIRVLEKDMGDNSITIEELSNTDTLVVVEMILSAYDSGFNLGYYDATKHNGCIVIYE